MSVELNWDWRPYAKLNLGCGDSSLLCPALISLFLLGPFPLKLPLLTKDLPFTRLLTATTLADPLDCTTLESNAYLENGRVLSLGSRKYHYSSGGSLSTWASHTDEFPAQAPLFPASVPSHRLITNSLIELTPSYTPTSNTDLHHKSFPNSINLNLFLGLAKWHVTVVKTNPLTCLLYLLQSRQ